MRIRKLGLVATLAISLLAGCSERSGSDGDDTPSRSRPSAAHAVPERPLRLPSITSGERCPVTARTRHEAIPQAYRDVLGDGSLGPVSDYFDEAASLVLRSQDRDGSGTYTKKVRWVAFDYTGPVLIRAGRIDGPGRAQVRFSYAGRLTDAGFSADVSAQRGRWQDFPATTQLDGPGCYAYQVDTSDSSSIVVFSAVLATG